MTSKVRIYTKFGRNFIYGSIRHYNIIYTPETYYALVWCLFADAVGDRGGCFAFSICLRNKLPQRTSLCAGISGMVG